MHNDRVGGPIGIGRATQSTPLQALAGMNAYLDFVEARSGVFLALKSAELAADAVIGGLADGDLSGTRLGRFGPDYVAYCARVRRWL